MNFSDLNWMDAIGLMAASLSAITFLPQVLQAWKTKSVKDLNNAMLLIMFTSIALWLTYGICKNDLSIIIANTFALIFSGTLVVFKFTFKNKFRQQ